MRVELGVKGPYFVSFRYADIPMLEFDKEYQALTDGGKKPLNARAAEQLIAQLQRARSATRQIICTIKRGEKDNSRVEAEGAARVHPEESNNRPIGRHIALERAVELLGLDKAERRIFIKQMYGSVKAKERRRLSREGIDITHPGGGKYTPMRPPVGLHAMLHPDAKRRS